MTKLYNFSDAVWSRDYGPSGHLFDWTRRHKPLESKLSSLESDFRNFNAITQGVLAPHHGSKGNFGYAWTDTRAVCSLEMFPHITHIRVGSLVVEIYGTSSRVHPHFPYFPFDIILLSLHDFLSLDQLGGETSSILGIFTPTNGEMIRFDEHILF